MRSLAEKLGVKPMALYHHVANKSEILDAIVDVVFSEIDLPTVNGDWKAEIHLRAASARRVLRQHPWAVGLMESRATPGPATLRHHDAMLGTLRGAGFSVEMTAHGYALIDSYIYGFALQEAALPFAGPETVADVAEPILQQFPDDQYPHLVELTTEYILKPGYDFGNEFDIGLDLILDALARSMPAPKQQRQLRPGRSGRAKVPAAVRLASPSIPTLVGDRLIDFSLRFALVLVHLPE